MKLWSGFFPKQQARAAYKCANFWKFCGNFWCNMILHVTIALCQLWHWFAGFGYCDGTTWHCVWPSLCVSFGTGFCLWLLWCYMMHLATEQENPRYTPNPKQQGQELIGVDEFLKVYLQIQDSLFQCCKTSFDISEIWWFEAGFCSIQLLLTLQPNRLD